MPEGFKRYCRLVENLLLARKKRILTDDEEAEFATLLNDCRESMAPAKEASLENVVRVMKSDSAR